MGVDHGGVDKSLPPRIWSGGIVPPDFVMLQNFKHQITWITMSENVFFCLYSRTFIVSPAMRPPRIPVRSTPMHIFSGSDTSLVVGIAQNFKLGPRWVDGVHMINLKYG